MGVKQTHRRAVVACTYAQLAYMRKMCCYYQFFVRVMVTAFFFCVACDMQLTLTEKYYKTVLSAKFYFLTIQGNLPNLIHANIQYFWPYGINCVYYNSCMYV